jgi:hypothetical protein
VDGPDAWRELFSTTCFVVTFVMVNPSLTKNRIAATGSNGHLRMTSTFVQIANRNIEARWRRGEISFAAFDFWLRWISGI